MSFQFEYHFHPAGQGLFSSGMICEPRASRPFRWVFDCGSTAPVTLLRKEVKRYRKGIEDNRLDLLCISHFDRDHVSGLSDLLPGLEIGTLVLPNVSRIERIVLGAKARRRSGGRGDETYFEFLNNPVGFVLDRAESVERVILVGFDPPDEPGEEGGLPEDEPPEMGAKEKGEWHLKPCSFKGAETKGAGSIQAKKAAAENQTSFVHVSSSLEAIATTHLSRGQWEFCFFHKPLPATTIAALRGRIGGLLADGSDLVEILHDSDLRGEIKRIYKSELRRTPENVNSSSLCVYTGPVLDNLADRHIGLPHVGGGYEPATWVTD